MAKAPPQFFGRAVELELLERAYASARSKLVVLHGRRRIGKSRLVQHFARGRPALLFEALEGERTPEQLEHFIATLRRQSRDPLLDSARFRTWDDAFTFLTERVLAGQRSKLILFFDEFPWMAAGRRKLVSLLKYFWDNHWRDVNILLVVCGSISSFMVDRVVRSRALYGRISLEICLRGLPPREAELMFHGRRSKEEVLRYLLIFGGVPRYLEEIQLNRSFHQNVNRLCFTPEALMVSEFEKIFYSQFREHGTYLRIVKLLRERPLPLGEIARKLRVSSGGGLKRYLTNLVRAEILGEHQSFGKSLRSKDTRYRLEDEYLVFYFKYIAPNLKTIVVAGHTDKLFERLCGPSFTPWLGLAFERFCLKHAQRLAEAMGFANQVLEAGPLFEPGAGGFQVDLLFRRADRVITLCEVKYHDGPVETSIIPQVQRKCGLLPQRRGITVERALISVHGPTAALRDTEYFHHHVTLDHLL